MVRHQVEMMFRLVELEKVGEPLGNPLEITDFVCDLYILAETLAFFRLNSLTHNETL